MKKLALAAGSIFASAGSAFAAPCDPSFGNDCVAVPEISALEGTAALAVVAALVFVAETFNTALEYLSDTVHPEVDPGIRELSQVKNPTGPLFQKWACPFCAYASGITQGAKTGHPFSGIDVTALSKRR